MIQKKLIKFFIGVLVSFIISSAWAFIGEDVIYIEADNIDYDYKKGVVNYEGNVHAKQGQTDLTAQKMIVYYNGKHKIEKVVANGKLAHYKTYVNNNKDVLQASAKTIIYYKLAGKVILKEDATVEFNKNLFSGPYIFYDMNKKVITSHPNQHSRSKVVLEPIKELKTNLK